MISHRITPGTTGLPGKCPCRKNSSPRTRYLPCAVPSWPSSNSSTRSMGSRCGSRPLISSRFMLAPLPYSILKRICPYSTTLPFVAQMSMISPSSSAVISFMSFMASMMQSTSPFLTLLPTVTKGGSVGDGEA